MPVTIFLCGDVMTGRGIDQILPHPLDPILFEPSIRDARAYVRLAEEQAGRIAAPVAFDYIWGEALEVLERVRPAARLINLETSVTTSRDYWEGKGIHYRMHPANLRCLTSAGIDCCSLANNHALDWGYAGLLETLRTLERAGIKAVGAGMSARQAAEPVALDAGEGRRVLVFAYGSPTSGVPPEWAATPARPGVNFLPELSGAAVREIAATVGCHAREGDVIIISVHWGGNWGYTIPREQVEFAHGLIDQAGVDIVHGHSSHHIKGLEIYAGRVDPLRLRRLPERLRGHRRPRRVSARPGADVLAHGRSGHRGVDRPAAGPDADPALPAEPCRTGRRRLAAGHPESREPRRWRAGPAPG